MAWTAAAVAARSTFAVVLPIHNLAVEEAHIVACLDNAFYLEGVSLLGALGLVSAVTVSTVDGRHVWKMRREGAQ